MRPTPAPAGVLCSDVFHLTELSLVNCNAGFSMVGPGKASQGEVAGGSTGGGCSLIASLFRVKLAGCTTESSASSASASSSDLSKAVSSWLCRRLDKRLELVPPFWVFRLSFSTLFRLANIVSSGWPAARGGAPLTQKATHAIDVGLCLTLESIWGTVLLQPS